MDKYVNKEGLQEYTTKLVEKLKVRQLHSIANMPHRFESAPFGAVYGIRTDTVNGQTWTETMGAQSLAVDDNNYLYVGMCSTHFSYIAKVDLNEDSDTYGIIVTERQNPLYGHINGMCWYNNRLYITCNGATDDNSRNYICKLTSDLAIESEINLAGRQGIDGAYGIATDGTRIWLQSTPGQLLEVTPDFSSVINQKTIEDIKPTLAPLLKKRGFQTIFWYNHCIFVVINYMNSGNAQSNPNYPYGFMYYAVYDEDTLEHIADIPCMGFSEYEGACVYKDTILAALNTSSYAVVVRGGLKKDSSSFGWATLHDAADNEGIHPVIQEEILYVDENRNHNQFFADGSQQYPFNKWWHYIIYSILKTHGNKHVVNVIGHISDISIRDCDFALDIRGTSNCTVNKVVIHNAESVELRDMTITASNPSTDNTNAALIARNSNYVHARNLSISGTADTAVFSRGTPLTLENFSLSGTYVNMLDIDSNCLFTGTTTFGTLNTKTSGVKLRNFVMPYSVRWPDMQLPSILSIDEKELDFKFSGNRTIDFKDTIFNCTGSYDAQADGLTFQNGPPRETITRCKIQCFTINGFNILLVARTAPTPFKMYIGITNRNANNDIYWSTSVNEFGDLRVVALGDSICYGARNNNKGYIGDVGCQYTNRGSSGATISMYKTNNIPKQLEDLSGYTPDAIISNGGVNDYNENQPMGAVPTQVVTSSTVSSLNKNTVMGALQYLFYLMITRYPNAHRFFLMPHHTLTYDTTTNSQGWNYNMFYDNVKAVCKLYGVRIIDVYTECPINTRFSSYMSTTNYSTTPPDSANEKAWVNNDGLHPLPYGYAYGYAPLVKEALRTVQHFV